MNNEIAEKIKGMLVERLRIPEDELEYDSELFGEDIGLDSIDSIEIIVGIENLFGRYRESLRSRHFRCRCHKRGLPFHRDSHGIR